MQNSLFQVLVKYITVKVPTVPSTWCLTWFILLGWSLHKELICVLTTQASRKSCKLILWEAFIFPLVCLWFYNFPERKTLIVYFLPVLITIGSYVPLWPNTLLCKDRLDYRRKYATSSENSEMSLTESKFLPPLMTCQLMPWAMARRAGWAMGAAIRIPRWLKISTGGRRQLLPSPVSALILPAAQPQ